MMEELNMGEIESYSILDIREVDPLLEKHRKDVVEKYLEYKSSHCKGLELKERPSMR